jgi:gluconokinase
MAQGQGLTDEQRWPWLERVKRVIVEAGRSNQPLIVACSALKEPYRRFLAEPAADVRFVFLSADETTLRDRLSHRVGHFAGAALLASQLAAVEPPDDAVWLDASLPVDDLVAAIRAALRIR